MKRIILIGGAPTTGKSTTAKNLGKHLGVPWIGSDYIRTMVKGVARAEDFPYVFSVNDHSAESYWAEHTPQSAVESENKGGEEVWRAIRALITESDYKGVIEGVAVLPHLVAELQKERDDVGAVFLVDEDEDRIRSIVYNRGVWDNADSYPDSVKEQEIAWVQEYNRTIINDAKKHGCKTVEVSKSDDDLNQVLKVLE